MTKPQEQQILDWFERHAKPFLQTHAPTKLPSIESEKARLQKLMQQSDEVTVCFLGNSGVGKSTLLNALAAGGQQVLPAGGIGPLTAQATEVSYSEKPCFKVTYHPKIKLWQMVFAIEARLLRDKRLAEMQSKEKMPIGEDIESVLTAHSSDLLAELTDEAKQNAIAHAESNILKIGDEVSSDTLDGYINQAKNIVCGSQFVEKPTEYLVDALRLACGVQNKWGCKPEGDDHARIQRVIEILKPGKEKRDYRWASGYL